MKYGWVPVDEVVAGIRDRARGTNVVVTGRDAPEELVELADTVTEMRKVKHAYDRGHQGQEGHRVLMGALGPRARGRRHALGRRQDDRRHRADGGNAPAW